MNLDLKTIIMGLILIYFLLTLAIYIQYSLNKSYQGIRWYLAGMMCMTLGFFVLLLVKVDVFRVIAIISNPLITLGYVLIYIGVRRFFSRKINNMFVIAFYLSFFILYMYLMLDLSAITQRTILIAIYQAIISCLIAQTLLSKTANSILVSSRLTGIVFLINGIYYATHIPFLIIFPSVTNYVDVSLNYEIVYIMPLVVGVLWTFGLVLMINQRLFSEVKEEKEKLIHIFNTSPDAEIITRLSDGSIIDVNGGFCTISGFSKEEVIGKSTIEINVWYPSSERELFIETLKKDGICSNIEFDFQRKDKSIIRGIINARIIKIDNQLHIVSVIRDISAQKEAELALIDSTELYRSILKASPDNITITDMKGKILITSPVAFSMFGYVPEDNHDLQLLDFIAKEDRLRALNNIEKLFLGTLKGPNEYIGVRKDGSFLNIEVNSSLIRTAYGEPYKIIFIVRDITTRKDAEHQIEELIKQLEVERNIAQQNAITDSLTGLANRRFLDQTLHSEIIRLTRSKLPISLIMLDVDHFKNYNDLYGHIRGDQCLQAIASTLQKAIGRAPDLVARYGGEEFVIVLPETEKEGAQVLAEHIRKEVELLGIVHEGSDIAKVITISLGVVTLQKDNLVSPEKSLEMVDKALYEAKQSGRNKVVCGN